MNYKKTKNRDRALMNFHTLKIREINKIIRELWQLIYKGSIYYYYFFYYCFCCRFIITFIISFNLVYNYYVV
jgi:hypothetical protein